MSNVMPPGGSAAPAMLCPRPRTATGSRRTRAWSSVAATSAASSGCTTSVGRARIAPFHRSVAAANPSSPGSRTRPRTRRHPQRAHERLRLLDGRVVAAHSTTCSGQPCRSRAASATASGVERSWRPQTSVVGTQISVSTVSGIAALAEALHQPAQRLQHARCSRAGDVVAGELGPPGGADALAQRRQVERALLPERVVRLRRRLAQIGVERGAEVGRRREVAQPERVDEDELGDAAGPVGGEARRDRAAERVTDKDGRRRAGQRRPTRPASRRTRCSSRTSPGGSGPPCPGRSGATTAWAAHSAGSARHQCAAPAAGPVQEDERRTGAALEHGRLDAGGRARPPGDGERRRAGPW